MEIRQATLADRPAFLTLWKEFLIDHAKQGGVIEVCDENIRAYLGLFESYIAGGLFGGTFIAWEGDEAVGVLMGGETPPGGFYVRTTRGRTCTVWGTYIVPKHRRKGIAWALQDMARPLARKQGFDTLTSSIITSDPVSSANALNWGLKITEAIVTFPLGETEHGRQRST